MKIYNLTTILALLAFAACENTATNNSTQSSENEQVVESNDLVHPSVSPHTEQEVAQLVENFYNGKTKKMECTKSWYDLVSAADAKMCEGQSEDECDDGYGYFDYDYFVMGQDVAEDFHVSDVKVEILQGDYAKVSFTLHNFRPIQMALELVYENNNWYIDNFINKSENLNLRDDMERFTSVH